MPLFKNGDKVTATYSRFKKNEILTIVNIIERQIKTINHIDYTVQNETGDTDCVNENYLITYKDKI